MLHVTTVWLVDVFLEGQQHKAGETFGREKSGKILTQTVLYLCMHVGATVY